MNFTGNLCCDVRRNKNRGGGGGVESGDDDFEILSFEF